MNKNNSFLCSSNLFTERTFSASYFLPKRPFLKVYLKKNLSRKTIFFKKNESLVEKFNLNFRLSSLALSLSLSLFLSLSLSLSLCSVTTRWGSGILVGCDRLGMLGYLVGLGSYGVYAWLLLGYNSFLGFVEPLLVDPLLGTSAEFL